MTTIKIFLPISIVIMFFISCSATLFNNDNDPILRKYTDVEGVEHLWKIDMDTLVFPQDNLLLDQTCYYHGGDVFGGESIKLYVDSDGKKSYVIRRVYPHVIEWKDGYEY